MNCFLTGIFAQQFAFPTLSENSLKKIFIITEKIKIRKVCVTIDSRNFKNKR